MTGPEILATVQAVCWCIFGCNAIWAGAWLMLGICQTLEGDR